MRKFQNSFLVAMLSLFSAVFAVAQTTVTPASPVNFGNVVGGTTSAPVTITLKNSGAGSITLNSTTLPAGSVFAFAGSPPPTNCVTPNAMAAGATCTITLTVTPTGPAIPLTKLTIKSTASNSPQTVVLQATEISSTTLSPVSLTFGNVAVGATSAVNTVTLTNNGFGSMSISSLSLGAGSPYAINAASTTCPNPGALGGGLSCSIGLTLTPTSIGPQLGTLLITDNAANSPQKVPLSGTGVPPTIVFSPSTLPAGQVGAVYSPQTITSSGGASPYTYTVTAGSLPAGLTLSLGGVLSGIPTTAGSGFAFTVTAKDSNNNTGTQSYTLIVAPPPITAGCAAISGAVQGSPITPATIVPSGGVGPYTFVAAGLPAGVTISSSTGQISGTPGVYGTFPYSVNITDSQAHTFTISCSLIVAPPTIVLSSTFTAGQVGVAYSPQTITASGGTSPYSYTVTSGIGSAPFNTLPAGMTLSAGGVLSGTPTAGGTFNFGVTATDSNNLTGAHGYIFTVNTPTIVFSPSTLPAGQVGAAYSAQTITASGGTSPYSYTAAGTLPAGMTLSSSGVLSGTPTAGGSFTFTVSATDNSTGTGPYTQGQSYTLTVTAIVLSSTFTAGQVGVAYSPQTITASGGTSPYSYTVTSGIGSAPFNTLPAGMTLSAGGVLSGTPTAGGTFNFGVTATDSNNLTGAHGYIFTVNTPTIVFSPSTLPAGQVGAAYSAQTITASGGTSPYSYTAAGTLPAGMTLSSSGVLSGTPTAGGSFTFTVSATDNSTGTGPYTQGQSYTLTVTAIVLSSTFTAGQVGVAYSPQTITASGGTSPYSYTVTSGIGSAPFNTLPAGMTLSAGGVLSGTPTAGGTFNFGVTATDSNNLTGAHGYIFTVNTPTIVFSPSTLPAGQVGAAYSAQTITASGGTSPYSYTAAGTLPAGMTLSSSGVLSGTPTAGGSFTFTVSATDNSTGTGPYTQGQSYTLTVTAIVLSSTFTAGQVGVAYSPQTITASGGTSPYSYTVTSGIGSAPFNTLPAGMTLSAGGVLSGTPTAGGTFNFGVTATDSNNLTGAHGYIFTVNTPTIVFSPSTLPAGQVGAAYSAQTITASGGTSPYSYTAAGTLPAGMTLSSSGVLSGTPTAGGSFTFTVSATDNSTGTGPYTQGQTYTLTVNTAGPPTTVSPASLTFAAQLVGINPNGYMTVTLTNQQPFNTLHVSGATITGINSNDFLYANTCTSVAPGASCQLLVAFNPTASGTRTAQLNIFDDASNSPQTVALTGPGNAPVSVLPGTITSFTAPVGSTSAGQTIVITNNDTTLGVHINSFQLTGDFTQAATSCGAALAAGASCNVVIQFAPTIGGTRTGQLQVNDSDLTSPQVVNLSGSGTSPLTVLPTSLNFSAQLPGTVSTGQNVTLHNFESQPETFTLAPPSGYTILANNCPGLTIGANSSCIITVAFSPSAAAANPSTIAGSLSIGDTAAVGSPLTVALTGSAGNPQAAVAEVTPGIGSAGNTSLSVVITGNGYTHFNASSVITFVDTDDGTNVPSDITVTVPTPSATTANQIAATLNIGANTVANPVTYGARNITVTTPLSGGGTEIAFLNSAFTITDPNNVHTITVVNPSSGAQGQTLNVGLTAIGTNFIQDTTIANFGPGITVNSLSITDPTDAVANITVSNYATAGTPANPSYRTIVMATGGEYASADPTAFQVTYNNATLTEVSLSSTLNVPAVQAQSTSGQLYLTATGTHFLQNGTMVSIGGGVIVGNVQVNTPTTATVQFAVPANATVGPEDVTVSTGGETATLANSFVVTGSTPALLSVSPAAGTQGQTGLNIVITGNAYTTFNSPGSTLQLNMTGLINVITPVANSASQVTSTINISQTMPVGTITANLIYTNAANQTTFFPFSFTVNASSASIVSVTPPCVPQGGQVTLALVGFNTIWSLTSNPVTSAAFYPVPVPAEPFINELQVQDMTHATLNVTVPTNTPVGNYGFYLASGGQVVSSSLCVYANTPSVMMTPANGLVPSAGSTNISVNFNGQFTNWSEGNADPNQNTQTPVIAGEGVTLSSFQINSPVSATATLSIAAGAATGSRLVTVTTGSQILTTYFNVTSTPVEIIAVNPPRAPQNTTLDVQIIGLNTHFCDNVTTPCPAGVNPSTVLFGPEITVNSVSVQDNTHLIANVTTAFTFLGNSTNTTPGYQAVYVDTGNEMVTGSEQVLGAFSVDAPATPTLLGVVPSSAPQGSTEDVTITGSLTNWVQGTTEAILGAGVTVANLTITGPTTATATISVSPTAPVGGNSVTMITGTEVEGGVGFSVTPSNAYIQSVAPVCNVNAQVNTIANFSNFCGGTGSGTPPVVSQLHTVKLSVVGVGTHWLQGDTTFSFGGGVFIDALTVNSPTTATVQITVLSYSPVGFASLTTTTDGEVVTLQQAIDIEEGFPTLLAISPGSGSQGATIQTFQVLGRFTNFCDNVTTTCAPGYTPTQLTFSGTPGITVSNINVIDNDNLTATITIDPLAYVDYGYPCGHVLTVTTSANEQVSTAPILDNFCVTAGPAQIDSVSASAIPAGNTGTITITGSFTHFEQGVTSVSFGDPNLTAPTADIVVSGNGTIITATLAASTSANPGTKTVTVSTFGEVASEQFAFSVLPDQPVLTEANPYQAEQGAQLYLVPPQPGIDVVLAGQFTHFSDLSTATFGPGIVVNSVTQQSATQVTANITIDPLSYPGGRTVTVTTPGVPCSYQPVNITYVGCTAGSTSGTGSEIVSAGVFQVIPGPAIISSVSPNTGNEGQEVVFNITGTNTHWQQNFTQFYIAGGGYDLTINSVIVNSPTSATVDMNISPTANPGARSIYMSTAGESVTDSGAFVVTGGVPAIAYISPGGALTGAGPVEVTIHGIYTLWAPGSTTLNFGPGVTVASYQVDDNFNIEAVLGVSSTATLGYHVFSVVTGTQVLTGNFLVTAAPGSPGAPPPPTPFIWSESPSTGLAAGYLLNGVPQPGQTMNVYFAGLYTQWDPNPTTGTQFSFGTGIQVNTCQVLSQSSALCNITVTATTAQTNLVVFTTPNGTGTPETETANFNIVVAQPTLSVVDPGSAVQGATNVTVNILGQFTAFDSTTTFTFGSPSQAGNITVVGPPTIISPTVAIQTISIDQLAQTGGYSVVANTPDQSSLNPGEVTVGGAGFSITPSLASIQSLNPNVAQQGATGFTVEVTGQSTHWDGSTVFRFGDGITVTSAQVNSQTDATLMISIPALASEGPTYVSATTGGEVATIGNGFVISAGTPYLLSSGPGSLPQQDSATFTILAQQTGWSAANPPIVSFGAGVNISNVNVTSPQSLTVTGSVQATTPVGYRSLTVTNGAQVLGLSNVLYITSGPAAINSVSPATGGQGVNLPAVQITGTNTNWVQGVTQLTFPGVLVNSFAVTSPTSITANITVSNYAPAGFVSVTTTTLGEVATEAMAFNVIQTQPELLAVVPSSAPQGWTTQNVTLTGDFTHFSTANSVANFGAGIVVNSVTANSFTSLVANVTVEPAAYLGYRNVTVTTGTEVVSITNAFNVTVGPAAIQSLNPASGQQNVSLTVLVTGSQTHFCDNVTTTCQNGSPVTLASFGGGINVTGIGVVDASHANVNITIPAGVSDGAYNVTLTTGGEVATILGGFTVTSGAPILTVVNPPTSTQGTNNLNVALTGLFTHFNTAAGCAPNCSTASFGAGITVNTTTAIDATDAVVNVSISPTATVGSRNVSVTTGAETASITGGFTVLAGVPAIVNANPANGQAGATLNVTINSQFTTFTAASTASFGDGIATNFTNYVNPTQVIANISIPSNATVGNTYVSVTTGAQVLTLGNAFAVTPGTPVITQINPNFGNPAQNNLTLTISGQYTTWTAASTVTIGTLADGISVGGATPGSPGPVVSATPTSVTVSISIAPGAPLGPAEVSVTTGASTQQVPAGFTVQAAVIPPPSLISLSPGPNVGGNTVPINTNFVGVFSQPMDRTTITTSSVLLYLVSNPGQGYVPVSGTVDVDASGRIMTFTPTNLLAVNSQYYMLLTNSIKDATGNTFPQYGYASFYTVFSANVTQPAVVAANPPANIGNVGTNVIPQLQFSVDMDQTTEAGMTLMQGGNPVPGAYSWNSSANGSPVWGPGTILSFTPTTPLTPNTTYTVAWGAPLTDTATNPVVPGSFTFTTGSGADTVTNNSGSDFTNGLTNVGTNFAPRMNFAKPVNPIDINAGTLFVYNGDSGKYINGTVTVALNGMSATFTPTYPLLPSTYYRFYQAAGNYDMDGNYLNSVNDYFTTGSGSDLTPPTVVSISPANNATAVPINAQVVVHFSAPVDPDTIASAVTVTPNGGSAIAGNTTLASDMVTLTFVPTGGLLGSTIYTIQVSGYADPAGNAGTPFSSTFTTSASIAPIVVSTGLNASGSLITVNNTPDANWTYVATPSQPGTGGVPLYLFSEAGTSHALEVVGSGDTGFYGGWPANGPNSDWININPNSTTGNTLGVYSTTFNIPGPTVPANLCLVGSVGIDDNGELAINGSAITSNISAIGSLAALNIPISSYLVVGSNTLSLGWGSTDNSYEAFRLGASIQTCGASYTGGLSITSETPAYGSTNVSTNTSITLTFDHPLDPATVNATTLSVMVGWNSNQELEGTYVVAGNVVTFTPDSPFPTNTSIYVGNCDGPYDLAGDTIPGCYPQYLEVFTTGSTATPAGSPFQVIASSPAANATNVGLRAPVAVTFNRSVNTNTINASDFALFQGDGSSPWCTSSVHSQDDTTIMFNCYPLPSSTILTEMLGSGLSDWQGNSLTPFTNQFTTTYYDYSTHGSVISGRPGNGANGVNANLPIVLYTNLPINPATADSGIQVAQNNAAISGSVQVLDNGYTLVFTPNAPWTQGALIQWWITGNLTDTVYNATFNTTSGYFFAAASTATLVPAVQVTSPPMNSSPVPQNIVFDVQFNTPLNPATITPANIFVFDNSNGNVHIPVTYSQPQPNEVRMVPTSVLPANHYLYVAVTTGVQSTTSVPATSTQWYEFTGSPVDSTLPVVVSAVPYNGAGNVGVNAEPGVVFNKAIDPVSLNANTFQVLNGAVPLAGSYMFSGGDTRVQFVPNAPLPANTSLTMSLNGVLDQVGNAVTYTSTFQTGATPDLTAPTVVWTSIPSNGSIPTNSMVTVMFSESMDVTTFSTGNGGDLYIYDSLTGVRVPATLSWNATQTVAYLVPSSPLSAGRQYYFYANTGTDLAGNQLSGIEITFYAQLTSANSAPAVINFNPLSGATGLGTNAVIEAQFSAPIDPNTVSGVTLKTGGNPVTTSPVFSGGNTVLQLVPAAPLQPNTTYTMTIAGVTDPVGNAVATVASSFTTGPTYDNTAPTVVTTDPVSCNSGPANCPAYGTNVTPKLVFSKPLNPLTVSNNSTVLYLNDTSQFIPATVTLSPNGLEVTLTPQIPLLPGTEYRFYVGTGSYVQDQDGNDISVGWFYFYTGSGSVTTGPTVTVTPANAATGIPLNAQVVANISTPIDPTSWTQNSIQLLKGATPVAGTVSLPNLQELVFAPSSPLLAGTTYTVNVSGFTDANGNLVVPSSTTFTTGASASGGGLSLISSNIPNGATNVATSAQIILTFSQILDPTTVNSSTMEVMDTWNSNQPLAATYAVSGNQVTITPVVQWPANTNVTVGECGGPTDVLGDVFYNGSCYPQMLANFTTTPATPDTTPLAVVSVNPPNGATSVRHDIPVTITFNESIRPGSAGGNNSLLYAGQDLQTNGSTTVSADGRTLTVYNSALYNGTTYTLELPAGGITDWSGISLATTFVSTFTTTTNPAAGNGQVQSTSPGNNTSGVPTDTLLTLYLNRPVNASTLSGNLTVTVNGQVQTGNVTSTAGGYEVQFTSTTAFPNSATVQWFFSNVEDIYGNYFNGDSGYFYTAAAPPNPATAQPTIVAVSPAYGGSQNMPTNGEIDIEYSLPLDPTTLTNANIAFYNNNPPSAGGYTITQPSPTIVRVTTTAPFSPSTTYYICANSNVKGTNGIATPGGCWTTYFTTTSGPDNTAGGVTIGPPDGSVNVGTNANMRLQFSKPVDRTSINATSVQITASGNPIPGTFSYNYNGADLVGVNFTPLNPLPASSPIQVSVSGLLDYAGNTFLSATSNFSTAATPDYTTPTAAVDFPNGQTGIGTNASFTCLYSEPMDPSSFNASGIFIYSYTASKLIPVTFIVAPDMMSVTMTPTSPLAPNAQYYYACYNAINLTGTAQSNVNDGFYTGSGPVTTGPTLVAANPPNGYTNVPLNTNAGPWLGSSLGLLFSEPVAQNSLGGITLIPNGGSPLPIGFQMEDGNFIVWVQLPWALLPNTTYTYNVTGVTDVTGNPMTPATSTFTTGSSFDYTTPVATAATPASGATGVNDATPGLSVTFNEPMDPVLIDSSHIYLRTHNTQVTVPTTFTLSADYKTVFLTPTAPLAASTIYDLVTASPEGWYMYSIAGNYYTQTGVVTTFTTQ